MYFKHPIDKDQMENYDKNRTIRPLKTGIHLKYKTSLGPAQRIKCLRYGAKYFNAA